MSALLFVFNPRRIDECIDAIDALDIDKCWLTGMTERGLAPHLNRVVQETTYDYYLAISDDGVPTQSALDAVMYWLELGHPVVTGYVNIDETYRQHEATLTSEPLYGLPPTANSYVTRTMVNVMSQDDPVRTWFAAYALTGMAREYWLRFPFEPLGAGGDGYGSDYWLSYRLQQADIPIVAPRAGYYRHVKERWNEPDKDPRKRLLVGEIRPEVRLEVAHV